MKNLFLNCALTQQSFVENEEIIVIPVTSILKEDGSLYLGTSFLSTFTHENPLGFDSLSTNKDYKKALSVLKNYLQEISLITNKTPLEVAFNMANNKIILHNINRATNSTHPWQEHELNFIFIKKNEFEKRQLDFESTAQEISDNIFMSTLNNSGYYNQSIKFEASHFLNKIYSVAGEHLNHLNIHFLRNFYTQYIFSEEKANIVKMSKQNFEDFIGEFQKLMFINSLHDIVIQNFQPQPLKKLA